jgi:tRNA (mo5U34)-methyltransferase
MMDKQALQAEINKVEWFHQIDLGQGIITPGADQSAAKLAFYDFPDSFAGKTVIDIGAWNGAFSFEAERRGASDILATDHFCWSGPGPDGKPGFDLAKNVLNSKVREQDIAVEDLSPETVGTWDYVLFLGVFYHLPDPIAVLPLLYAITRQTLIIETLLDCTLLNFPAMAYFGGIDGSRRAMKFVPNEAFIVATLCDLGFRSVDAKPAYYHDTIDNRPVYRRAFHAQR